MKHLLFLLVFPFFLSAHFLEVQLGYFYPQDKTFRNLYHNGGIAPALEADICLYKNLHLWGEGIFFVRSGHQTETGSLVDVFLLPLSLGLKYQKKISCAWDFYIKAAPNWYYLHTMQEYPYVKNEDNKNGFGFTAGLGVMYHISSHFFVDLTASYLYDHKSFIDPNSQVEISLFTGGVFAALGAGFLF